MLEGLDKIEWDKLGHAYGPAEDVPDLIRDLASPDEGVRNDAWHALHGNIWHQGTVYEATAYAAPFFIELLEAPEVLAKHEILAYLARLSTGTSYKAVHSQSSLYDKLYGEEMKTAKWQEELKNELSWVERVKFAVEAGRPLYLEFLKDPAVDVRDNAAYLLTKLNDTDDKSREQIQHRLEIEKNATVQVSLLLALGKLSEYNESTHAHLSSFMDSGHPKAVTLAAAIALADLAPEHVTPEMISRFVEAIRSPGEWIDFECSIWADDDTVAAYICLHLRLEAGTGADTMADALLPALGTQNITQAQAVAKALLAFVFDTVSGAPFASWPPRQQRVLQAFVANKQLWGVQSGNDFVEDVDTMRLMRRFNLPDRFAKLSAFIRGEAPPEMPPLKAVKSGRTVARVIKNLGKIIKFP